MKYYPQKSIRTAYLLWLVSGFGWLGLHRIYLDKHRTCLIWTLTFGLFGIGAIIDLFLLRRLVLRYNIIQQRRSLQHQQRLLTKKKAKLIAEEDYKEAALCRDKEMAICQQMQRLQGELRAKSVWPSTIRKLQAAQH